MFPPTYKLPPIPAPPVTFNAPSVEDVELVLFVTLRIPFAFNAERFEIPSTVKPVNVPRLVMLPCDAPVTVPA